MTYIHTYVTEILNSLYKVTGGAASSSTVRVKSAFSAGLVEYQDEQKANCRLAAAVGGSYEITDDPNARVLGSGACVMMTVKYHSAALRRGETFVDTVKVVPPGTLVEVIDGLIASKLQHFLKCEHLPLKSPSMWWSLVRFGGGDVAKTIIDLVPSLRDDEAFTKRVRRVGKYSK